MRRKDVKLGCLNSIEAEPGGERCSRDWSRWLVTSMVNHLMLAVVNGQSPT